MKRILFIILVMQLVRAQSVDAALTIYKDGFGLIKQPVSWNVAAGKNTVKYDRLTEGLFTDSPFLDLKNSTVLSQRFERNVFSSGSYYRNRLGEKVDVQLTSDKKISGILIEYNANRISIKTKSNIISANTTHVEYISVRHNNEDLNLRPILAWDVYANKPGNTKGNLVYLSSGFDWNANYRMILQNSSDKAVFIPEAFITNNSNLSFSNLDLNLVEGTLNRVQHQEAKSLMRPAAELSYSDADMAYSTTPTVDAIGDYYIYDIPYKLNIEGRESVTVRLYDARDISYKKTYLFKNYERSQKEEPLEVELEIENTQDNNLNIPLPQGKIELFQSDQNGELEFLGEDIIKQIPKGSTAQLIAGRAFDVTGKRTILNYDRQRKSEEASIEIKISNVKDVDVNVRLIEQISGEWVIKDESSMYIKQDASTIYFPLTVPANSEVFVTYTYRKEWN